MRSPNIELRVAIVRKGILHGDLEERIGLPRTKLSRIINGWIEARWHEKDAIAGKLGTTVDQIFSRVGGRANA
ncbi:MAG: hypothetical protein H8E42_02735 [Nitrospinae bacterium]|nr:hypothetical protein [Nitrospinota bacterium]